MPVTLTPTRRFTRRRIPLHALLWSSAWLALLLFTGRHSVAAEPEPDLRFAVFGDLHYNIPAYAVAGSVVEPAAQELAALGQAPSFLLQTGDFIEAARNTDFDAEAAYAFEHFSSTMKLPFYIAIGNHDHRKEYEKNALPIFSQQLGKNLTASHYSFDKGNCHFLLLDCLQRDFAEQLAWAEADLKAARANPKIERIFAAGHYPFWIVARCGFTPPAYAKPFAELLARYGVDAYFCGHTHNKSVTVRLVGGKPLTQIMGCAVVGTGRMRNLAPFLKHLRPEPADPARPGLLPLEESRNIFIPPDQLKYYWGYQEGTTSSYNIVTVRGPKVTVDWHVLDQGIVRSYEWDTPGQLLNTKEPAPAPVQPVSGADLRSIQRAWYYVAPWTKAEEVCAPFTINGIRAGACVMTKREVAYSAFWNMLEIPLAPEAVAGLRKTNTLRVSNPGKQEFGLAHSFLLAQLKDGRLIKTGIAPAVFASFPMTNQERFFPVPELIRSVNTGGELKAISLTFEHAHTPLAPTPPKVPARAQR